MQTVNSNYKRFLDQPTVRPIWLFIFEDVPTRFSTGTVKNALGITKPYAVLPESAGAQITVDEGRSSFSSWLFKVLDVGNEVTLLLTQFQFANRLCTIKTGFAEIDEADYVTAFTGRLLDFPLAADNNFWQFEAVSIAISQSVNIFDAACLLVGDITNADTTINVDDSTAFPAATAGVCYVRIDDEVFSYTGNTGTSFTGCTRGELGTAADAHVDGTQMINVVILEGNPMTLALQIMMSTGAGTNGPYDVLPACAGLSIPEDQVNVEAFENQRDLWLNQFNFRFEEQDSTPGLSFLQEQIYSFSNSYPVVDNEGRLSVKVYAPPLPNQLAPVVSDNDMAGAPKYQPSRLATMFYNEIRLSFDWDFVTKTFGSVSFFEDLQSQVIYNTTSTRTLESRGMRGGIGATGTPRIANWATRFLKRFSVPPPSLNGKLLYDKRLLEPGDVVPITSIHIPNLITGKKGVVTKLMELVEYTPDPAQGVQTAVFLDTGYTYGHKYAGISPSKQPPINFPNYLAATPQQRNYAFISEKTSPTAGVMSNGDDGYYITP